MIKAIIFDFDGVLVPIDPEIKRKLKQSIIKKYSLSASLTQEQAKSCVENAIRESEIDEAYFKIADAAVKIGSHDRGEMNVLFHTLTRRRSPKLQKIIFEMLSSLHERGLTLGIITISSKDRIEQILKDMRIREYFCFVESAASELKKASRSEWKKAAYKNFLDKYGFKSREVLSVGDSFTIDLGPARELGMQTALIIDYSCKEAQQKKSLADYNLSRRMLPKKLLTVSESK
jgi:FMN phosphatase YigB (HAD superfamily)